jgi:hypothetical protein
LKAVSGAKLAAKRLFPQVEILELIIPAAKQFEMREADGGRY